MTGIALGLSFVILVLGTWLVPYLFPSAGDQLGSSSVVGYSNAIAYVVYVVLIVPCALALARLARDAAEPVLGRSIGDAWNVVSRRLLALMIGAHVMIYFALFAYKGRFVFSDALHFQALLHRMAQGEVPYRDFAYFYGPSMLYPAAWLNGLIGVGLGYAIWYVATYVAGLVVLYLLLGWLLGSRATAATWFVILSVALFTAGTGVNLTFLRYLLPLLVFALAIDALRLGGGPRIAAAAAVLTLALTYSFDIAAVTLAGVAMLVIFASFPALTRTAAAIAGAVAGVHTASHDIAVRGGSAALQRGALLVGAGVGAAAVLLFVLDPSGSAFSGYPMGATTYLGGAYNLPLAPHLTVLALAAFTVLAGGLTVRHVAASPGSFAAAALLAGFGGVLATERGGFASSDPDHIVFYGLPVVLLGLHLTTTVRWGAAARRVMLALLLVGFAFPMQMINAVQVTPFLTTLAPAGTAAPPASEPAARAPAVQAALTDAVLRTGTDRPWVMYDLGYYRLPVYERFGLRYPMYVTDLHNAIDKLAVARAIAEVRATRAYVIVRRGDLDGSTAPGAASAFWTVFAAITGAEMPGSEASLLQGLSKRRLEAPFLDFVRTEYRPLSETGGLVVLTPR